jgi:drug/metabolite transporter (DMT)-like permease
VPLARLLLGERLDRAGAFTMALAFSGALVMLWRPEKGLPWPANDAEWLALAAGFLFALGNVLVRRIDTMTDAGKSLAIWIGVTVAGLVHVSSSALGPAEAFAVAATQAPLVAGLGIALVAMSLALQFGLGRTPANRAVVILLVELPVATFAAWVLSGEVPRIQDYLGGALIVAASLAPSLRFLARKRSTAP